MNVDVVAAIIQGGAVGLAFFMMAITYLLTRRGMELVNTLITNHLEHLTQAIDNNTETVTAALERNSDVVENLDKTISVLHRRI